jgi:dTDP-3,4-didehydro-2,6-dideoxy-alpha-D-glucose 3-reductase
MMEKINIGVLGCANIAQRSVIPAIKSLPKLFNLVAVASRSKEKADTFAAQFDCEAIYSYEEMICRDDIDALYIPLPTGLHEEWINKALMQNKHVYAEKSIAFKKSEVAVMLGNAKEKELTLMEGFMFRYHCQHKTVKDIINNGTIGEIRAFYSSFGFPPLNKDNFRYISEIGGGALYDAGAYPVSASLLLLGNNISNVTSSLYFDKNDTNIFGNGYLAYSNGVGAHIAFGFDNYYECKYEIWGSKGKISALKAFTPKPDEKPILKLEVDYQEKFIEIESDNHFKNAFIEFYNSMFDNKLRINHYNEIEDQIDILEKLYSNGQK